MTEKEQENLFEAFEQASEEISHEYRGTGPGLAITRNMCRLMGGDIELKSEKGVGSTFTIWLPEQVREEREGVAPGMRSTPAPAEESSSTPLHGSQGPLPPLPRRPLRSRRVHR